MPKLIQSREMGQMIFFFKVFEVPLKLPLCVVNLREIPLVNIDLRILGFFLEKKIIDI